MFEFKSFTRQQREVEASSRNAFGFSNSLCLLRTRAYNYGSFLQRPAELNFSSVLFYSEFVLKKKNYKNEPRSSGIKSRE